MFNSHFSCLQSLSIHGTNFFEFFWCLDLSVLIFCKQSSDILSKICLNIDTATETVISSQDFSRSCKLSVISSLLITVLIFFPYPCERI